MANSLWQHFTKKDIIIFARFLADLQDKIAA